MLRLFQKINHLPKPVFWPHKATVPDCPSRHHSATTGHRAVPRNAENPYAETGSTPPPTAPTLPMNKRSSLQNPPATKMGLRTFSVKRGGPRIGECIRDRVLRLARENIRWGYTRIQSETLKRGRRVGRGTVAWVLGSSGIPDAPNRCLDTWRAFLRKHRDCGLASLSGISCPHGQQAGPIFAGQRHDVSS